MASKEQVESLGGKFVMVEDKESQDSETSGGYAKEMSAEYQKKQEALLAETLKKIDIVICTALIPGKKHPLIIKKYMLENMNAGSVIVDLAVESGGNCELSKDNDKVIVNDIIIIGDSILYNKMGKQASLLYSKKSL